MTLGKTPKLLIPALAFGCAPSAAWAGLLDRAYLQYLTGDGVRAHPVVHLTWGVTLISLAVIVIISAVVVTASIRRGPRPTPAADGKLPVGRRGSGLSWIYVGTGLSTVVLLAVSIWTMVTLAAVAKPPVQPGLTIEIHGHQWWWEALYVSDQPSKMFRTADDFHIPVGVPVRLNLVGDDVIHSFWVPALSGKMDTIPGQNNSLWIEADRPGTYRGQCTEYCGQQHAHMGFTVTARPAGRISGLVGASARAGAGPAQSAGSARARQFSSRVAVRVTRLAARTRTVLSARTSVT